MRKRSTRAFFSALGLLVVLLVSGYLISGFLKPEKEKPKKTGEYISARPESENPKLLPQKKIPVISIIIDDLGYNVLVGNKMVELDWPLTCAIVPNAPYTSHFVERCAQEGKEIIVHMPMEPAKLTAEKWTPGTLAVAMTEKELDQAIEMNVAQVPSAIGVNHHMGSEFTIHEASMKRALKKFKEMGLFYVDSWTAYKSVGEKAAKKVGIKYAVRDIFIDHEDDTVGPEVRLDQLEKVALRNGKAVAICHPKKTTLEALKSELPGMIERGIKIVPISEVVIQP